MKQKPINLNLLTISFPATAIASILHRISGVLLFLAFPLLLWLLNAVMHSQKNFEHFVKLDSMACRVMVWLCVSALFYHVVAGLRHIIMDMGIGESKEGGRITALLTLVVTIGMSIALGWCYLW